MAKKKVEEVPKPKKPIKSDKKDPIAPMKKGKKEEVLPIKPGKKGPLPVPSKDDMKKKMEELRKMRKK